MVAPNSKNAICNMALSELGNYGTVNNIDAPSDSKESAFALWYDVTRQAALRLLVPNFAMTRRTVAKKTTTPTFGYSYAYEYPSDCLKVLGFGETDARSREYNVELGSDGTIEIQMDEDYPSGLPLRFIADVEDVSRFTPDFKILFSIMLGANVALPVTQKQALKDKLEAKLPQKMSELSGVNAQENPPVRVSVSNFKASKYTTPVRHGSKR